MPLSPPQPRKMLHMRDIQLRGYERAEGFLEIEARVTDIKTYSYGNIDRNGIQAGEPLHDMWLRVTMNAQMEIVECEASMDATPYSICPGAAGSVKRLIGLTVGKGFMKSAMQLLGGVEGCTHLRELLQPIATVVFQTVSGLSKSGEKAAKGSGMASAGGGLPPGVINSCLAYDEAGPVVARSKARAAAVAASN